MDFVNFKTDGDTWNAVERSNTDSFFMTYEWDGELQAIELRSDYSGVSPFSSPDWYIESVNIKDEKAGVNYRCECNAWLGKKKGDKKLTQQFTLLVV